jgi:hypothetical protein
VPLVPVPLVPVPLVPVPLVPAVPVPVPLVPVSLGVLVPVPAVPLLPVPAVPLLPLVEVSPVPDGVVPAGVLLVVGVLSLRWQAPNVKPSRAAPSATFDAQENAFILAPRSRLSLPLATPWTIQGMPRCLSALSASRERLADGPSGGAPDAGAFPLGARF